MSYMLVQLPLSKAAYGEIVNKVRLAGQEDRIMSDGAVDMREIAVCCVDLQERHRLWEDQIGYDKQRELRKLAVIRVLTDRGGPLAGPKLYEQDALAILQALGL